MTRPQSYTTAHVLACVCTVVVCRLHQGRTRMQGARRNQKRRKQHACYICTHATAVHGLGIFREPNSGISTLPRTGEVHSLKTPLQQLLPFAYNNSTGHAKAMALTATRIMLAHNKARALKSNMVQNTLSSSIHVHPQHEDTVYIYHYAGVDKQVCLREKCSMQRHNTNTWRGINHSTEQLWARQPAATKPAKNRLRNPDSKHKPTANNDER